MMFECPNVLFLNCLGSYFYSIINSIGGTVASKELLCYLSTGFLKYEKLDCEEVYACYNQNPWGYQPIRIKNIDDKDISIDSCFFDFLRKNFNISTHVKKIESSTHLIDILINNYRNRIFCICNVDEFYLPTNYECFQKKHNKHFLLIDKIDLMDKRIQLIDSEKSRPILLTCEELNNCVIKSAYRNKMLYTIDCNEYRLNKYSPFISINPQILFNFLNAIHELIEEMFEIQNNNEKVDYYFRGYYYSILSKVLPYFMMINVLVQNIDYNLYLDTKLIIKDLRGLINFMRFKICKHDYNLNSILKKIQLILDNYKSLYSKLELYLGGIDDGKYATLYKL